MTLVDPYGGFRLSENSVENCASHSFDHVVRHPSLQHESYHGLARRVSSWYMRIIKETEAATKVWRGARPSAPGESIEDVVIAVSAKALFIFSEMWGHTASHYSSQRCLPGCPCGGPMAEDAAGDDEGEDDELREEELRHLVEIDLEAEADDDDGGGGAAAEAPVADIAATWTECLEKLASAKSYLRPGDGKWPQFLAALTAVTRMAPKLVHGTSTTYV